jgi:hypothetical protein
VRDAAHQVQEALQLERKGDQILNSYVVGDMILFDEVSRGTKDSKLKPRFSGPYVISSVHKADLTCYHLVTGKKRVLHMDNVKPYFGSKEDAYRAAQVDDDQYVINRIIDYMGETIKRSKMEFLVLFEDEDCVWIAYNRDLASSAPFETYCRSLPELEPLLYTEKEWRLRSSQLNSKGVVGVVPGQICYVTLRAWGSDYYRDIGLPEGFRYVVPCEYVQWNGPSRKKIELFCEFFNVTFRWDATAVRLHGMLFALADGVTLVDEDLRRRFPRIGNRLD